MSGDVRDEDGAPWSGNVQEVVEIPGDFSHRQVFDIETESLELGHALRQDRLLDAACGCELAVHRSEPPLGAKESIGNRKGDR